MSIETENLINRSKALKPSLSEWRRALHQFPELSFQEEKTSRYIQEKLEEMGVYQLHTGIAGFGMIAELKSGDGPVIGVRADMDALPIHENTGAPYTSRNNGIMHACGHDAHSAMLLGVANLLAEDFKEGRLQGTVKLIFQPAEEDTDEHGSTGAPYLLQSGKIDDVEAAIALHVCPWRRAGEIQIHAGPSMASIDNFILTIMGTGGHGGYPYQGTDPVWIAASVIQGIYGLISRRVNPLDVGTISIGGLYGGSAFNVIPDKVMLKGTIRSYTPEVRLLLMKELENVAQIAKSLGGDFKLEIEHGEPALRNDPIITELMKTSAQSLYPEMPIFEEPYGMGGEDFSHITEKVPGAMLFLGCGWDDEPPYQLHTADFDLNEEALPVGVALLTDCTYRLLQDKGQSWR
ncbi:M20 metallopeptidase family protein [Sediminibacillus massiliensis]|uniref:M20 metallopeptidase family protein n=1 Tax=Sediminibacillus massiliensis TaxID=1926277 RepID=UPI0009889352|nr:M20 family metallopeptidase [Sediminibacillus massiliensis]